MYSNKTSLHTSQDRGGTTALMIASFRCHSNVVRKLLQAGATVNTTNRVCRPVLDVTHASLFMCLVYVKVWTVHVCTVTNVVHIHIYTHISQDGWTALHLAAQEGHEDVVELLLEAKADPELKTKVINIWTSVYSWMLHGIKN